MKRESKMILGGLTPQQIRNLSPEVRAARAAYISDSYAELDTLFESGVTELRLDHPEKDDWSLSRRQREMVQTESLEQLSELGYQIDQDGKVHNPEWERD